MVPPRWFTLSIDEDVQALVWAKDYLFDKNEIGSMLDYSRWMKAGSQTLKTKDGFGWKIELSTVNYNSKRLFCQTREMIAQLMASFW